MREKDWKRLTTLVVLVVIFYLAVTRIEGLSSIISKLISVFSPFLMGLALAFIINLPVRLFDRLLTRFNKGEWKGYFRIISIVLSLLSIALVITIVVFLILPDFEETIRSFIVSVPAAFDGAYHWVNDFLEKHPDVIRFFQESDLNWNKIQVEVINQARGILNGIIKSLSSIVPTVVSSVVDFFVALVFAISLVAAKEEINRQFRKLNYAIFNFKWARFFENLTRTADQVFSSYITGQSIEAVLTGIILYVLMKIFNFPYALSVSVITGLTTFIPIYGAFIGGVISFILIAATDFVKALWFVLLILFVQVFEGNILYPRVMGSQIGIPSLWILVVVTIGGSLFGFAGMLLAVPIFSIIYQVISENVHYSLDAKKLKVDPKSNVVKKKL